MEKRDLIIIGGGVGGLVTASVTAQLGLDVTLIEASDKLGGDCLHYGCVPSKSLIQASRVASIINRGAEFGLDVEGFGKVNLGQGGIGMDSCGDIADTQASFHRQHYFV